MSAMVSALEARAARAVALTHRGLVALVSALLLLPTALFAMALQPMAASALLAGCAGTLALIATARPGPFLSSAIDRRRLALCCVVAAAVLLLGGETHLFFTTWDWLTRDAVLADLVAHGFPLSYRIGDADYLLRAPLGLYVAPAAIGRILGLQAAHLAMLAQNAVLFGAILYLLGALGRGWPHVAILLLFAGLSVVGASLRIAGGIPSDPPFWLQWGLDSWHPMFQFSGTLVQMFWVPNHALPAWWLATLLLLHVRGEVDVAVVGVSIAAGLFWSPLSIVSAVPWLVVCAVRAPRAVLLAPRTWLGIAVAACFLPLVVFLVTGSGSIASGSPLSNPDFVFWYALFIAVQLPAVVYLACLRGSIPQEDRMLLIVCVITLLALPFFRFGPNNDLVMRASIAPLTIVAFVFGRTVIDAARRGGLAAAAGWTIVALGTMSAFVEIGRAIATPSYAISTCSVMDAHRALGTYEAPGNYVAAVSGVASWLVDPAKGATLPETAAKTCWPDRAPLRFFGLETLGAR